MANLPRPVLRCGMVLIGLLALGVPGRAQEEFPGVVAITLEHADGRVTPAMALVIGNTPPPARTTVALVSSDVLYSADLEPARTIGGDGGEGQLLDVPMIEVGREGQLEALATIALARGPEPGTAACLGAVVAGQELEIASVPHRRVMRVRAAVVEADRERLVAQLRGGSLVKPRLGDPVFLTAALPPQRHVVGVVAALDATGRVEILTLAGIFRRRPAESGPWVLQPAGLCDPDAPGPEPVTPTLERLLAIETVFTSPNPLPAMRAAWGSVRAYLDRPGIEHYLFHPAAQGEEPLWQFWQSMLALAAEEVPIRSPLAALSPLARVRTRVGSGAADRGWAVAAAYTSEYILLITAHHLVAPGPAGEREILVYLPAHQGLGVPAKRLPIFDKDLDLAVIVIASSESTREKVFGVFRPACGDHRGAVEVPMNAWGWRRERQRGLVAPGDRPGQLRVSGVQAEEGFSGGALVYQGMEIVGILTKSLGRGRGSLGVSIEAAARLVSFADGGFLPRFDCPPESLQERAVQEMLRALTTRRPAPAPDQALLATLFAAPHGARIDPSALPSGLRELPGLESGESVEVWEPSVLAFFIEERLEGRCAVLRGQHLQPDSQELIAATSPLDASGRPRETQADSIGCDIPLTGAPGGRPFLRSDLALPLCGVYPRGDDDPIGLFLFHGGRVWDAAFLMKCRKLDVRWYEPAGWLEATAAEAARNDVVTIPAGRFAMGGCTGKVDFCGDPLGPTVPTLTPSFSIARMPVTVAEYAGCVAAGRCEYKRPEPDLDTVRPSACNWGRAGRARHPMNCVDWNEASTYCTAAGGRLPTETEWEKAARGTDGRAVPWGNAFPGFRELPGRGTIEVGRAPDLASPYGVEDIAWHVEEWTDGPFAPDDGTVTFPRDSRTVRGRNGRTFHRIWAGADYKDDDVGFRCVFPRP